MTDAALTLATLRAGQRLRGLVPGQPVRPMPLCGIAVADGEGAVAEFGREGRVAQGVGETVYMD